MSSNAMSTTESTEISTAIKLTCKTCNAFETILSSVQLKLQPQWQKFKKEAEEKFLNWSYVEFDPEVNESFLKWNFIEYKCSGCATTDDEKKFHEFAKYELSGIFIGECRPRLETPQEVVPYDKEEAIFYLESTFKFLEPDIHKKVRIEYTKKSEKGKGKMV